MSPSLTLWAATNEAQLQSRYDARTAESVYLDDALPNSAVDDYFEIQSDPILYLEEAIDILKNLFKLLPTLQAPLGENQGFASDRDPYTYTEHEFHQVAVMMFPKMHNDLAKRFGHGNWCRRRYIWRLSGGNQGSMPPGPLKQTSSAELLRLEKYFRERIENKSKTDGHHTILHSEYAASTIVSSPETVLTVLPVSKLDSATTSTDDSQVGLLPPTALPDPPVTLPTTTPFNCTFCQSELPLTLSTTHMDQQQWSTHIYRDLKPYICTFGDCFEPRRLYNTRRDWFQHELNFHRSQYEWSCSSCQTCYDTADAFEDHLGSAHSRLLGPQVQLLLQHCRRYKVDGTYNQQCAVCDFSCATIDDLEVHLGAHQEAYAPATFFNKEVPTDTKDNSNMIEEFIEGLPELVEKQEPEVDNLSLGVLASLNLSPPAQPSEGNPMDHGSWSVKHRGAPVETRDDDHTLNWIQRQTSHKSDNADQGLPDRYENFVGRDVDLDSIHAHLHLPGQICSVSGRGGIGKTAIAIEYMHKYKGEYSAVFWIEAETPGVCAESFGSILSRLEPSEKSIANEDAQIFQTREYLTKTDRRWLIIFDNVSSWKSIARYVPRNLMRTQGSVLVTTRTALFPSNHRSYQNQHAVELLPWPPEHGRQFLMTSIHPRLTSQDVQFHEDFPFAEQVLNVVGGLPLAISMIVGYVKVSRCTLADFLEMWEEKEQLQRRRRRNVDMGETDIDATIDSLWTIGIREVRMNSRRLLDVMSFLDPERIQKALLVGDHQEEYLDWIHVSEALR